MINKFFLKLMSLFLNKEQMFEFQMRRCFNAKKFPKVVNCDYCGRQLKRGTKKKAGDTINRWSSGNGTAIYFCNACDNVIHVARESAIKDLCICKTWGTETTIERCLACKDKRQCEKLLGEAEENAIKNIKEASNVFS